MTPATLLLLATQAAPAAPAAGALVLELDPAPFAGVPVPERGGVFTVLAGDADLDGDPDLIVNWHVAAPLALLANEGGRFVPGARPWIVPENASVPFLDAAKPAMLAAIRARARPGIYLWRSERGSAWSLAGVGALASAERPATLCVEANRPIRGVVGLPTDAYEVRDERFLRIPLGASEEPWHAFVATENVAVQLQLRVEGADVPLFLGPDFVERAGPVEVWGRDPHGLTWLDVAGSARPDLAVVRGALRGALQPPLAGKLDELFLATDAKDPGFERVELPRNYGRGRMAQWVDLEGDGRPELYVGNKDSPNALLRFEADFRRAADAAPALGLDLAGADAFAWLDVDGDGDDDLVTLDARAGLGLARNERGARFELVSAAERGLVLAPAARATEDRDADADDPERDEALVDSHELQLLDVENDGDLDLLVSGWGAGGACALLAAEGERFVDATARAGLAVVRGTTQVVVADLDADGWLDLLCLGSEPRLLRNERGRFAPGAFAPAAALADVRVGTVADVDGDGRLDVVVGGRALALLRNRSAPRGDWVTLTLTARRGTPVGSVVRASYADGTVHARRVGSTHCGHLAQGSGPLLLATSAANPLRRIDVRFATGEHRTVDVTGPGALALAPD